MYHATADLGKLELLQFHEAPFDQIWPAGGVSAFCNGLQQNDCLWNCDTCRRAAKGNHLKVLWCCSINLSPDWKSLEAGAFLGGIFCTFSRRLKEMDVTNNPPSISTASIIKLLCERISKF